MAVPGSATWDASSNTCRQAELREDLEVVREAGDAGDAVPAQREDHDAVGLVLARVALVEVARERGLAVRAGDRVPDALQPPLGGLRREELADRGRALEAQVR